MLLRSTTPTRKAILNIKGVHCHVHQSWPLIGLRSVHSEPAAPSAVDHSSQSENNVASHYSPITRRQATLHTKRPSSTSKEEVLAALKHYRPTNKFWEVFARSSEQALVILATPSFSKWLEDESFIADVIGKVARAHPSGEEALRRRNDKIKKGTFKPLEMDVVCACVDGIAPHVDLFPHAIRRSVKEGFSILQGPTSEILPNLWDAEDSITKSSPTMTASLTFAEAKTSGNQPQIVLPLANTLFTNGRHSTLLISKWMVGKNGPKKDSFVKVRDSEKRNQIINVFAPQSRGEPSIYVPAIPLTPARRIISGLGNIVRQIEFGDEEGGPASRELEANIDEYLLQTRREKSTVAVWALIIPKDSISQQNSEPPYGLLYDPEPVKIQWQERLQNPSFIGHWISRGARLCRVLSGGGGWGAKQGLLSLDPQSTYSEISEARFDFSTESLEEQQVSALGNIAEPDAYIQFFTLDKKLPRKGPLRGPRPVGAEVSQMTIVVGAVPSTIDDQRIDRSDLREAGGVDVACQPGHFGAVSEAGLFLSAPSNRRRDSKDRDVVIKKPVLHTKIDLPYSYIYKDFRLKAGPGKSTASDSAIELYSKKNDFWKRTSQGLGLRFRKISVPSKEPPPTAPELEESTGRQILKDSPKESAPSTRKPQGSNFQVTRYYLALDEPRISYHWVYAKKEPPSQELEQQISQAKGPFWQIREKDRDFDAVPDNLPEPQVRNVYDNEPMADSPVFTKYYVHGPNIRKTNKTPKPEE